MNIRQLELFSLVAETGSVTKAANQLYMTQPAVSQAISDLEDNIGVRLFERINRKMLLTDAGEILYIYSKKILRLLEEAEGHMKDIANMRVGKLSVGASTTIGIYLLPLLLGDFRKKYNSIHTHFVIDNTAVIEEMILHNTLDAALVEGPVHHQDIIVEHMVDDELYLICSPHHHWVTEGRTVIEPSDLFKESIIVREHGSGTREVLENALAKNNITYEPTHVLNNTEAIKNAVKAGIGVAFVSRVAVEQDVSEGRLVKMELSGIRFMREFKLIYHKDKFISPLLKTFIDATKNYAIIYKQVKLTDLLNTDPENILGKYPPIID